MTSDTKRRDFTPDTELERWLVQATWRLAEASAAQVRSEIGAHYREAVEEGVDSGASEADARRAALESLGSPHAAGKAYRRELLTRREASLLNHGQVARTIAPAHGARRTVLGLFVIGGLVMLIGGAVGIAAGSGAKGLMFLMAGLVWSLPFLPQVVDLRRAEAWHRFMDYSFSSVVGLLPSVFAGWMFIETGRAFFLGLGTALLGVHVYLEILRASLRRKLRRAGPKSQS